MYYNIAAPHHHSATIWHLFNIALPSSSPQSALRHINIVLTGRDLRPNTKSLLLPVCVGVILYRTPHERQIIIVLEVDIVGAVNAEVG